MTAAAQSHWQPETSKRAAPAHVSSLMQLPADSVTRLVRDSAKATGGWTLQLPDGSRQRVVHAHRLEHPNGDVTWTGSIAGAGSAYSVIVTEGAHASFGEWTTPRGRFRFEAWGDEAWLVNLDHADLRVESPDTTVEVAPSEKPTASTRPDPHSGNATAAAAASASKAGETIVDVLFVYSAGFAARYPQTAAATRVNFLVAVANQILSNSDINGLLRLVGAEAVGYTDGNDNGVALNDLRGSLASANGAAAGLNQMRARRQQTGADLVTLIRPHDIELRGNCGIASLFGRGAAFGANVVSDGVSSWSICSDQTYAHEIGHNLGAEHQNGANSPDAGSATAHVRLGQFHTLMGSFGTGDPNRDLRLARFSNPLQLCGGLPCGVRSVSDNARRVSSNFPAVAAYVNQASAAPVSQRPLALDPDEDNDGVPESQDAFPSDPLHQSDRDLDGVADGIDAFPDNVSESIDTDVDGIGDNADPDRDGDSFPNAIDALPLNAGESIDSDFDGVGDNADAFDSNRLEWGDLDADGVGDNADTDVDGDGTPDFAAGQFDLLVASVGTDRVVRLDGDSGRFVAIEIAERHAPFALGPKSTLAWNPHRRRVEGLIASEVRRFDSASRTREARVLRSFRGSEYPSLPSGLPDAMTLDSEGRVYVSDSGSKSLRRYDAVTATELPVGVFSNVAFFTETARALAFQAPKSLWSVDKKGQLKEVDTEVGSVRRQLSLPQLVEGSAVDPQAMIVGVDGRIYVADSAGHRVLRVDTSSAGATSVFVRAGAGGLAQPSGLAFDHQGRLYVSSADTHRVLRFDAAGEFIDTFSVVPEGVLAEPRALLMVPRVADRYPRDAQSRLRPRVGAWYNPLRTGQGIDLQAIEGGLALAWYTYDDAGRPTWYLAVGPLQGDSWSASLQRYQWNGRAATPEDVGAVSLNFSSEDQASFSWQVGGRSGVEPFEHLQFGNSVEAQFPTSVWYEPATSGWGYSIARQGDIQAITTFFYDHDGQPTWAIGADRADAQELPLKRLLAPGACPGCSGNTSPIYNDVGIVRFIVTGSNSATGSIDLRDSEVTWFYDNLELVRLSKTPTLPDGSPPLPNNR